jgi:biotin synthase
MLTPDQARRLKEAGLSAYNHNLDTSREFYPSVITTRSYEDRLGTLQAVRDAGIKVCSGGILGLGEKDEDRVGLIWEVGRLPEHPESFPVNTLVPIPGTPLEKNDVSPGSLHTAFSALAVMGWDADAKMTSSGAACSRALGHQDHRDGQDRHAQDHHPAGGGKAYV